MTVSRKQYSFLFALFSVMLLIANFVPYKLPEKIKLSQHTLRFDYLLHAAVFFLFTFLLFKALPEKRKRPRFILPAASLVLLYSFALELLQKLAPKRTFNLLDVLCNGIGVALALAVWFIIKKRKISGMVKK